MIKKKSNTNWYLLLAGILALYFGFTNHQTTNQAELRKITVELSGNITNVRGKRSSIDYKFWTTEYKNQFNILKGSITRGKHETILNLKRGQVLDLFISTADYNNLVNEHEDITIRGIRKDGVFLISQEEFYNNRKLYKMRLTIFAVFTGLMLLLNGLATIPNKINYLVIGIFIGAILLMRIFEVGLY